MRDGDRLFPHYVGWANRPWRRDERKIIAFFRTDAMLIKSMTAFIEALQAKGRHAFTLATEAEERSAVALEAPLRRLKEKGRIASPRRGF